MKSSNPIPQRPLLKRSMRFISLLAFCGFTFSVIPAYSAEYYKWVDEEGTVHFSEKPPTGDIKAEKLKTVVRKPVIEDVPDEEESVEAQKQEDERPLNLQFETTKDPQRCQVEQARLKALQSNERVRMVKKDGSFEYLDAAQIAAEVGRTKEAIRRFCD